MTQGGQSTPTTAAPVQGQAQHMTAETGDHGKADKITVVLADDHSSVRAGLRLILETAEDVAVVGEAADGPTAVAQARALRPDVVLMDARMPGGDGIAATREIVAQELAQVLMLTTFDVDEVESGQHQLLDGVRAVAHGDGVVAPEVTRRVLEAFVAAPPSAETAQGAVPSAPAPPLPGLTERETEVLAALGEGASNAQIAAQLTVSLPTVKTHVSNVLTKLHVTTRMQAAVIAREHGLA